MLRRLEVAPWLIGVLASLLSLQFAQAQTLNSGPGARPLITQGVNEGNLAALRGNTRPEATPQNDRGAVADGFPMAHLLLQLRRAPEQEAALQRYLDEVQDPTSANFHKWLTAEQFGQQFGAAQQDLDTISRWLESHGFSVNLAYPNRMVIDFSGTVGQVREAFHTEIHNFEVRGENHIANMSDPQIPAALAPSIVGIVSLHDFKPRGQHEMRKAATNYTFNDPVNGPTFAAVPADLATIYNLNPLFKTGYSGQGQTIVVIEDTNVFKTTDWNTFRTKFGLSTYTSGSFTTSHPAPMSGPNNCANPGVVANNDGEAILDAEWASAAAPSAAIHLASCADTTTTFGGLIALQNLINASGQPPAQVSISYGECETENGAAANAAYNGAYQQAVSEGVAVFVSAGDSGAAACDNPASEATHGIGANAFASTPYNVAVGGTDFSDTFSGTNSIYWNPSNSSTFGSALSYIPEIPWNDSCGGVLLSALLGEGIPYGADGFCNDPTIGVLFLTTTAGGGGPSGCATGSPAVAGVVGGTCQGWPKPSWQTLLSNFGNPNDGVRDTPDVSLFAANGLWSHYYIFCWSDTANGGAACSGAPSGWSGAGGTSFSAPIMAGIQALVNQKTGQRQGNPNPIYYQLAASEYNTSSSACNSANGNGVASTCIFYDVTQGDMDVNCTGSYNCYLPSGTEGVLSTSDNSYSPAYGATSGWDFATGIGSVNAANLVNNWPNPPQITSAASTTFLVGSQATFAITATGEPTPSLTESGALPSGVTFNAATGVLGGTPATGSGGVYNISFTASNGMGTAATQNFTLTVDEAPVIASANSTHFAVGSPGTFTVTERGFPVPTLTESGGLPNGVTFNAATGVLGGTPTAGTAGIYHISFTASNGMGENAVQSFTLTVTSSTPAPAAVSVTPNSGIGTGPQTFTYLYSDSAGYQNIYLVQTILNSTLSWPGSCGTMYSAGSLYLMKDDGSSWMGPLPIGQSGMLQNSQCTLNVGASSATGAGTNLTVNLVLSFSSTFTGTKNEYMQALDVADNLSSGFQNLGTWTPNAIMAVPAAVSVTPNSGIGTGPQTFTYLYSDSAGYQNIYLVQTILNSTLSWPGSCGTMYSAGSLYLMKDDGSSWMGPLPIGQSGMLQNSQCTLNVGASSATGAGTNLTVNLVLSFSSTFTGTKNEYMQALDVADNLSSGFQNLGTWTPNAITAVPAAVSVTPNSGIGTGPQTFTYLYSDAAGYQNIYLVQQMLNTALNWPGSCGTMYSAGSLYLMRDDGSSWMGPLPIGQPGTLQNSQCTLDVGASSATGTGTNLTVNLVLSFSSTFTGTKNEYMQALDVADNLSSGFQNLGTWTPNALSGPSLATGKR